MAKINNVKSTQDHVEDIFGSVGIGEDVPEQTRRKAVEKAVVSPDEPDFDAMDNEFDNRVVKPTIATKIKQANAENANARKNSRAKEVRPLRENTEFRDRSLKEFILNKFTDKVVFDRKLSVPQSVTVKGLNPDKYAITLDIAKGNVAIIQKATKQHNIYPLADLYAKLYNGANAEGDLLDYNTKLVQEFEEAYPVSDYAQEPTNYDDVDPFAEFEASEDDLPENMQTPKKETAQTVQAPPAKRGRKAQPKPEPEDNEDIFAESEGELPTPTPVNNVPSNVPNFPPNNESVFTEEAKLLVIANEFVDLLARRISFYLRQERNS